MQPLTTDMLDQDRREARWSYPGWKIVVAGFFGVMASFASIVPYTFGLFIKPLSQAFGWHREAISAGFSIAALTVAAASPGLGGYCLIGLARVEWSSLASQSSSSRWRLWRGFRPA